MFEGKTIGVVIPAYNEEKLIGRVFDTMPDFVDTMIVVNDKSTDATRDIVEKYQKKDKRIILINHEVNKGLGQSLIDGYLKAREMKIDVTVVMAGDAQMSPNDLPSVIFPVVKGEVDYVKGNRLLRDDVISRMPGYRYKGNSILTLLTKFATGYWRLIDPQCGYTAISADALARIPIHEMTKGYGYNADILNMLNLNNYRVRDVEVEPVYAEEQSKIKLASYIRNVSILLLRLFFKRMVHKYLVREFNPLIFFYLFSIVNTLFIVFPMVIRLFYKYFTVNEFPHTTLAIIVFSSNMAFFSFFFGMWLDMEDNRKLQPLDLNDLRNQR